MRRYKLTGEQYALLEPYLLRMKRTGGHPWSDHRRALNGLFWKLRSGDMPERYGPCSSISDRYRRWCREGRFAVMLVVLRTELDAAGLGAVAGRQHADPGQPRRRRGAKKGGLPTTPSADPGADMAPSSTSSAMGWASR